MTKKLIVVGSSWCGGCVALKTQLVAKSVEFEYVDADDETGMEFCHKYGVKSLPTSFIIDMVEDEIVKVVLGNKVMEIVEGLK